jgi:hypothetical protein
VVNLNALFKLKKPCENCPFRKVGAIQLRPGRVEAIVDGLIRNDQSTFHCHKTVHGPKGGGDGELTGEESYCTGALIYLQKIGQPNVAMRMGAGLKMFKPDDLAAQYDVVIDKIAPSKNA